MQSAPIRVVKNSIQYAPSSSPSDELAAVVQQVIDAADMPLSKATTLPRAAYLKEEFFDLEVEKVFSAGWMCVGHASQVKEPGSYLTVDLLNEPLVIVRGKDDQIRVLSRICPHRATDIMHECFGKPREGRVERLVCPYHAWGFGLDGKLTAAPEMEQADGFCKDDWRLPEIRSGIWEGFIFVNLDGNAPPLEEQYADFHKVLKPWNAADMEVVIQMDWECEFNWKVMIENWMEPYHHIGIHSETIQPSMPARMTWTEPEHPHFFQCHLVFRKAIADEVRRAAEAGLPLDGFKPIGELSVEEQTEWGLFLGYPCFMVLTARDRILWYRLQPISAGRCRVLTTTMVRKDAIADPSFAEAIDPATKMLSDFHLEDMQVCNALYRGLKSNNVVRGRLSHLEEPLWLFQRYLAARLQGKHPAPAQSAKRDAA